MTDLVRQRTDDDCTVCCIAMATGQPYEAVMEAALGVRMGYVAGKGTYSALRVLGALGVEAKAFLRPDDLPAWAYAQMAWGRRAILMVKSLNEWPGHHDVYWDGAHLRDPSNKTTYPDALDGLEAEGIVILQERPDPA